MAFNGRNPIVQIFMSTNVMTSSQKLDVANL